MLSRVASWHHGSSVLVIRTPMRRRRSSSAWSVILGNNRVGSAVMYAPSTLSQIPCGDIPLRVSWVGSGCLAVAQHPPIDLAGRCFWQFSNEGDKARIFVLAEARAHEIL